MNTLRLAALALMLAACGGVAIDSPSLEDLSDDLADLAPAAVEQPAPVEPTPAPAVEPEPAPSTPAPSDEPAVEPAPSPMDGDDEPLFELPQGHGDPRDLPAPSPATRDDEPTPAPGADEPGWIEGGDICTADEQCVDGLHCAEVSPYLPDGSGYYANRGERRCAYTGE